MSAHEQRPAPLPDAMPSGQYEDRYVLFALLNALVNRIQAAGDAQFEEVTWKQWFALLGVSVFPQPPGVQEVAALIGTSHQNLKQLLLRLEKTGLVRLGKDPADARRTLIHTTPHTQAFERKYRDQSGGFMQAIYEGIPQEDIAVTRRTVEQMNDNLRRAFSGGQDQENT